MTTTSRRAAPAALAAIALALTAACGSGFDESGEEAQQSGPVTVTVLIASSGDAETAEVTRAAQAWAAASGNSVKVTPAQDMQQQLGQGFASGNPPDVFYVDAGRFADYASVGALEPYAETVADKDDFYPNLRASFTYENRLYCLPKDFSTLALVINDAAWTKAGLTDADVPATWDELTTVAAQLTAGDQVGLALGDTRDRIGAFMVQSGGWIVNDDATQATADTPQNRAALEYVRGLLADGVAKFPGQLDSGWAGEAFGKEKAAMTIEGNWIAGAMTNDFPDVKYTVAPLPAGPAGQGTLSFTQCWGIAAASANKAQALDLVTALTTKDAQLSAAEAFGVMPSRASAREDFVATFPQSAAFIEGADYAQGPVNAPKMEQVLVDFDTGLQSLPDSDPAEVLRRLQANATAALGG
jgi:multiple sugar transport system substrate-binding protein